MGLWVFTACTMINLVRRFGETCCLILLGDWIQLKLTLKWLGWGGNTSIIQKSLNEFGQSEVHKDNTYSPSYIDSRLHPSNSFSIHFEWLQSSWSWSQRVFRNGGTDPVSLLFNVTIYNIIYPTKKALNTFKDAQRKLHKSLWHHVVT